ncbi:T9SS type A sorting domain-containing protein [Chryseosolibacter indicus]|uniref:T9SS type A sorting domain-containing protein n=1 Tax=Chryseosolibacter indicus TaxID=2782351 RepID=A0ABS5VSE1_9BACT|nr:T9SS type A sorting domain-containing protein [Chryseosolibacter indicus]MBT1704350.1 T9SS type A sorting domain-containing protein [Chryseosolibacter indicus]
MYKIIAVVFSICSIVNTAKGQTTRTMNTSGSWHTTSNWAGSNIGDDINDNVVLNGNASPIVRSTYNYTIRNFTGGGDNTLTIESSASLTLGSSTIPASLSMTGNNPKLSVLGTLIIWGNASFTNKVSWEIRGTVIIKGDLQLSGGANLDVKNGGQLIVEGNMVGGNNTDVTVNGSGGTVRVYKNVNVSSGNLNGGGTFEYGGTCTSGSNFCNNATRNTTLPVKLSLFEVFQDGTLVRLNWRTETERNSNRFIVERSVNGEEFEVLGETRAAGNSNTTRNYSFKDDFPVSGLTYYRLKTIDLDDSYEYFGPKALRVTQPKSLTVYPNPVVEKKLIFHVNFAPSEDDRILIVNVNGVPVLNVDVKELANNPILLEDTFQEGIYLLKYISKSFQSSTRVLVK